MQPHGLVLTNVPQPLEKLKLVSHCRSYCQWVLTLVGLVARLYGFSNLCLLFLLPRLGTNHKSVSHALAQAFHQDATSHHPAQELLGVCKLGCFKNRLSGLLALQISIFAGFALSACQACIWSLDGQQWTMVSRCILQGEHGGLL